MAQVNLGRVVGYSAYEVAVNNGYTGTEAQWLASLKGEKGDDGEDGSIVTVSATGTATDEVSYITIDGTEKKIAGGGGSAPSAYLKSASVASNTLTLTKQDDTTVTYTPDLSNKQDVIDSEHKLSADLITDGTTNIIPTATDETNWNAKSVVSGTDDGTNWTAITINGTSKNIPSGGSAGVSSLNGKTGSVMLVGGSDTNISEDEEGYLVASTIYGGGKSYGEQTQVEDYTDGATYDSENDMLYYTKEYAGTIFEQGAIYEITVTLSNGSATKVIQGENECFYENDKYNIVWLNSEGFGISYWPAQTKVEMWMEDGSFGAYTTLSELIIKKTPVTYTTLRSRYMPIDNNTITINSDGNMCASGGGTTYNNISEECDDATKVLSLGENTNVKGNILIGYNNTGYANTSDTFQYSPILIGTTNTTRAKQKVYCLGCNNTAQSSVSQQVLIGVDNYSYRNNTYLLGTGLRTPYVSSSQNRAINLLGSYNEYEGLTGQELLVIGNGTSASARSNALVMDATGLATFSGNVVAPNIPAAPSTDGTYTLQCVITDGVAAYSWVSQS